MGRVGIEPNPPTLYVLRRRISGLIFSERPIEALRDRTLQGLGVVRPLRRLLQDAAMSGVRMFARCAGSYRMLRCLV